MDHHLASSHGFLRGVCVGENVSRTVMVNVKASDARVGGGMKKEHSAVPVVLINHPENVVADWVPFSHRNHKAIMRHK